MSTKTIRSIKGKVARFTRLDQCGVPVQGTASSVVTSGFVTVTYTEEIAKGDEYTKKNAWGDFCVNEKDPDLMKWVNVVVNLCEVDPDILDVVGGATPVIFGPDTIGWTRGPNAPTGGFAIEVWTKKAGVGACGVGGVEWGYFVVPFVTNGKIDGAISISNAAMDISLHGEGHEATAAWGTTPYATNPFLVPFPVGEMYGAVVTTVQPPDPTVSIVGLSNKANVDAGDVFATEVTVTASDSTNAAKLTGLGYIVDPAKATAWLTGEFFTVGAYTFNWSGTAWAAGAHA